MQASSISASTILTRTISTGFVTLSDLCCGADLPCAYEYTAHLGQRLACCLAPMEGNHFRVSRVPELKCVSSHLITRTLEFLRYFDSPALIDSKCRVNGASELTETASGSVQFEQSKIHPRSFQQSKLVTSRSQLCYTLWHQSCWQSLVLSHLGLGMSQGSFRKL
jgi:hypothetical protein